MKFPAFSSLACRRLFLCRISVWAAAACIGLGLSACSEQPAFGGVDITGADYGQGFSMIDHDGHARTLSDFKGKVVVVFFGYVHCPDVCPTTLTELAQAKQLLGDDGRRLQALFISLDPERDTPDIMKAYMAAFDPDFLALYAKPGELPQLAKSFKVYYKKVEGKTPSSYTMDHTAGSYVYDTRGRLRLYERYGAGGQVIASDVKRLLSE